MSERKIVVLTPVKNEAWILPLFCQSASIWADYIIIADQNSTDGSKDIACKFPKVVVIDNNSPDLDENYRDRILVEKARELVGNNGILFRIDADELFTPNFDSVEWGIIKQSKPGTIWWFKLILLNKNLSSYWVNNEAKTYGAFVDDGREYTSHGLIHSRAMFTSSDPLDKCVAEDIELLHFQFADWSRMQSKHRWYQCFERINFPEKSTIEIYRKYHWMYNPTLSYKEIPSNWFKIYKEMYDIDLHSYIKEGHYWWDDKIEEYFLEYSPEYFRNIETCKIKELPFAKGKNILDKLLLLYLYLTKEIYNTKKNRYLYKFVNKIDYLLKNRLGL